MKNRLKMEPKSIKNPSKNRCEKNVDFKVVFSGFFRNFWGRGFALFTFGKEGQLQKNNKKEENKKKEQCR